MRELILKPGRERSVAQRHPWIFSGAIYGQRGTVAPGDICRVVSHAGEFLAWAYVNPHSQIAGRILSFSDEVIDAAFVHRKIQRAIERREALPTLRHTNGRRLIAAEADGFPGLIVDQYDDVLVAQLLSAGVDRLRDDIVRSLVTCLAPRVIIERSDVDVRKKEGLSERVEVLWGDVPTRPVEIHEHGRRFFVDVMTGHKTGFYLDQRDSRASVGAYSAGAEVLNVFSYTGGFGVYAATAGASSVLHLDASADALQMAATHMAMNEVASCGATLCGDAFQILRRLVDEGRKFDLIVLDPPKFVQAKAHLERACRGYKDINRVGMQLLRPGGHLFTFSCSGLMSAELFQKVVFGAALDAQVDLQVLGRLGQAADHPFSLTFPEGEYLKGLICRVVDGPGASHA